MGEKTAVRTVARHAHHLLHRFGDLGWDIEDLNRLMWRSMPRFGRDDVLGWLLQLRGDSDVPSQEFEALLEPEHPSRRRCLELLTQS